jgi:hypothetical protein
MKWALSFALGCSAIIIAVVAGWTLGAGRVAADLVAGVTPEIETADYGMARFD